MSYYVPRHLKQEYSYKTNIIRYRPGWTKRAIELFLGEPDKKRRNPYKKGTKRCLYLRTRVLETEKTAEFQEFVRKNRLRVEAGKRIRMGRMRLK